MEKKKIVDKNIDTHDIIIKNKKKKKKKKPIHILFV